MDHSRIYQHRFDELLKLVKRGRRSNVLEEREDDQIIDVCGNGFREYQGMVSYNESWAIYTMNRIARGLLDQEEKNYYIPKYEEQSPKGRTRKIQPFAFAIKEEKGCIGYVFLYKIQKGLLEIRNRVRNYEGIDGVRFYFLQRDYHKQIDMLNDIEREDDDSFLEFYNIKDFFEQQFGENEYSIFLEYVERFNERARNLIGFKTVAIPNGDTIELFKKKKVDMLEKMDYKANISPQINNDQVEIIINNYINSGRYLLMTGNGDFADSFISSEWYYSIHTVTGAIDQTGLVTGYLKSVEQLLYALIRLSIKKNRRIRLNSKKINQFTGKIYTGSNIDYTETNEEYADTTLGSLIHFIKNKNKSGGFYNADLFDVDTSTIQAIIDTLYEFKDVDRNDRLHKDNLYTSEEVDSIREKALTLYCLLLGSFKMSSGDYAKLMADDIRETLPESIDEVALLEMIKEWVRSVLMLDMPVNANTVAFCFVPYSDGNWALFLQGLDKIPDEKYKTIEWNQKLLYSSSMTDNIVTWKSEGKYEDELGKLLRILRKMFDADFDAELATLLKKYSEVVVGYTCVIEVLYKDEGTNDNNL